MNENRNDSSSTNTILIVLVLMAIVGFGVWYFTQGSAAPEAENPGINVDVNMPDNTLPQEEAPQG